jgi:hypothetical protein
LRWESGLRYGSNQLMSSNVWSRNGSELLLPDMVGAKSVLVMGCK